MRTLFDDAIGAAPPSTVDVDRVVERRRRADRYRRAGLAVTAVAGIAGIVVGLGAIGAVTADRGPAGQAASVPAPAGETPAETAARLTAALRAVVAEKAPGFTASADDVSAEPFLVRHVYREGDSDTVPADHYLGSAMLTDAAGSGQLLVTVDDGRSVAGTPGWARQARDNMYSCRDAANVQSCQVVAGPGGERITRMRFTGEGGKLTHWVRVLRPDGIELVLTAANDGGQADEGPPRRAEPVLTIDQLVAIGTDPRLSY